MLARRTSATVAGAILGLALLGGGTVSARAPEPAGSPPLSIQGALGVPCIGVYPWSGAGPTDEITVQQKRNGTVISSRSSSFTVGIYATLCLKPMKASDELHLAHGTQQRTATVPGFTASQDLATDTVSGITTASGPVTIAVRPRVGPILTGLFTPSVQSSVAGDGTFSATAEVDIRRGDRVTASTYVGTDNWRVVLPTVTLAVQPGSAVATGTAGVSTSVTATLRAPDGTVRGHFKVKTSPQLNTADTFRGTFRNGSGKAVKVRVGDRVRFSGMTGSYTVPAGTLKQTPSDTLTTKCAPGARWMAAENGNWFAGGTADDAGTIAGVNVSDIVRGAKVTLACDARSGWRIVRAVTLQ